MIAICFQCGAEKGDAFGVCEHCNTKPETEENLVISALLTVSLLDEQTLLRAKESETCRDPKKISKGAYDLIANFLREDGILPKRS